MQQKKQYLSITYKSNRRSFLNYTATVGAPSIQNYSELVKIVNGNLNMISIEHLHGETKCCR